MRTHLLSGIARLRTVLAFCAPVGAFAQFEVHVDHAFPNVCEGRIQVVGSGFDQVVWSTGDEGPTLNASPGVYGFTIYDDGLVVLQDEREIALNGWQVDVHALPLFDGVQLSGTVGLQHCGTSIFNSPCCVPVPELTSFKVLQDGEPYLPDQCLGCSNIQCAYGLVIVSGLPYGHVYTYSLNDPTCAGEVAAGTVTAYGCANLQLELDIEDAVGGGSTGSITVIEAIPDPTEPMPITAPVMGTFRLFNNISGEPVGDIQTGGTANWPELPAGEYLIAFSPDQFCQTSNQIITINDGAAVEEIERSLVELFPRIADDHVALSSSVGDASVEVSIIDLKGRVVVLIPQVAPARIPVGMLAAGPYVLVARRGGEVFRARFIKR